MNTNNRTMTVKMKRRDLCDLMIACTVMSAREGSKWVELHDMLMEQLFDFDERIIK